MSAANSIDGVITADREGRKWLHLRLQLGFRIQPRSHISCVQGHFAANLSQCAQHVLMQSYKGLVSQKQRQSFLHVCATADSFKDLAQRLAGLETQAGGAPLINIVEGRMPEAYAGSGRQSSMDPSGQRGDDPWELLWALVNNLQAVLHLERKNLRAFVKPLKNLKSQQYSGIEEAVAWSHSYRNVTCYLR